MVAKNRVKRSLDDERGPLAERVSVGWNVLTVQGCKRVVRWQDRNNSKDLAYASATATG